MQIRAAQDERAAPAGPELPDLESVKQQLRSIDERVVGFIKAHPGKCLLGAVALGWLAGRLARRGWGGGHGSA